MQSAGYSGGRMMSEFLEQPFGWDVSDPDLVDDTVWEQVYETHANDASMKEWFQTE